MEFLGLDGSFVAFLAYVVAFGLAGVVCLVSIPKAASISDADTRRGLISLLVLCGGWAMVHVGFLVAPTRELQTGFYVAGLAVGFAATGAWLYFCSAYTGRTLHRNPYFRWIAVGVYVGVIALKFSNPLHGLYFSTTMASMPFTHLAIHHGTLHWVAMGLAYALATVGYFMLLERFLAVGEDTRPLTLLVGLTGLPLAVDVLGRLSPRLLDMTYEPLGVAAFAVGVLYLYFEEFRAVQIAGSSEDPVIVLDVDGVVREYNRAAADLFPDLASGIGTPLREVVPSVQEVIAGENDILTIRREDGIAHYRITRTQMGTGDAPAGSMLTIEDVTAAEESRRALEREKERLDRFASVVAHDLRNPLNVADGRLDLAVESLEHDGYSGDGGHPETAEHLDAIDDALERMEALIDDLLTLARQGQDLDEIESVSIGSFAEDCWGTVDGPAATLVSADDPTIRADPERLRQLLENLFRNAIEHGGEDVTITVGSLDGDAGFYVEDDGPGIPAADRTDVFEAGMTTNPDGTGFGLAIVEEIADAHGWDVSATAADDGGARFEIRV
ncbi:histidine kinase [Salinarchaeum sp. Harcht-Bsk1]|uniref:sensor histidine kinase n=1 Tax=Salinarchaeum sp. Harcht-Bsk1 TaxID=1333523 RepID=UPI00034241D5|nr:ATP-binding protein [Salinarchaeum sp. Harcht-Bsk1]AGN02402.1 histidine kinase [Salinarchaeum sp. Harcht-Bsk1]